MKISIYCIFDENGVPLYIGKTKNDLSLRESQHRRKLNKRIYISELDVVDNKEWKFWESYWIEQFQAWGFILKNKNKGGGGPEFHPKEVREKMSNVPRPGTSAKLKGRKRPDVSKRIKGSSFSSKTKQKISEAKKGHECYASKERAEKIKKSNLKHYQSGSLRNKKISKKLTDRKCPWISYRKKEVVQLDKKFNFINEYPSVSEAANSVLKPISAISECCNKKRKSAYNYVWIFKEEYVNLKTINNKQ